MIKIGIVDKYLDNWHTNYYPGFLRDAAAEHGFDADICYAYAERDGEKVTTDAWCREKNISRVGSYEELLRLSDAIMVMCADDCRPHEALAAPALASGKPVFCDKTFAPDLATAKRMFALAEAHRTPMFSCSAQRFCTDLNSFISDLEKSGKQILFTGSMGPGDIVNYSVHQLEMIERIMGTGAACCTAFEKANARQIVYTYDDGRIASFAQIPCSKFRLSASDGYSRWGIDTEETSRSIDVSDYYGNFMKELLTFFTTRIPPVKAEDTLEITAMQEAAREALTTQGIPVKIKSYKKENI